jgi:hypothetical protein
MQAVPDQWDQYPLVLAWLERSARFVEAVLLHLACPKKRKRSAA